jgi:hypothetical protein
MAAPLNNYAEFAKIRMRFAAAIAIAHISITYSDQGAHLYFSLIV